MDDFFEFRKRPNIGNYPSFYNVDFLVGHPIKIRFGVNCSELYYLWKDERVTIVLVKKTELEDLSVKILEEVKTDANFIKSEREKYLRIGEEYLKFCQQNVKPEIISQKSSNDLNQLYKRLCAYHQEFSFYNVPLWFCLGDVYADFLKDSLKTYTKDVDSVFLELSKPTIPTYLYQYQLTLFSLFEMIKKKEDIQLALATLKKTFGWIPFDYVGPKTWGDLDFIKQANEIDKRPEDLKRVQTKQIEIAEKLLIPYHLLRLFNDFQISQVSSDEKKEYLTKAQIYWQTVFLPELSKRIGMPPELIRFMTMDEIESALLDKKIPERLEERPKLSVFKQTAQGFQIFYSDDAQKISSAFDVHASTVLEVRGRSACLGFAKGKAKILLNSAEITKIEKGDILISTMTTPDYVPAMKKASAIVTDEGGMTSHAAIISREFGIPCVVGTTIATKTFKDGEIIEVDANHGIVRKVS